MAFVGRRTAQTHLPGPGGSESSKAEDSGFHL